MRLTEEDRNELTRLVGYMQAIEMIVGEKLSVDCKNALAKGIHYYGCKLVEAIENALVEREEDEERRMKKDEVIHCRDCAYFTRDTQRQDQVTGLRIKTNWCETLMTECEDDDFCSWADRKDDEQ